MFGVLFPNRSFPMDISTFSQIDTFHWILDMNTFVGEAYDQVSEICIFLLNSFTLPPDKALAVYIQSPGSPFLFCGAVTLSRPSAVLSLPWPEPGNGGLPTLTAPGATPLSAKIGVSVEDLATLPSLDVTAGSRIERLAMKVGENLFNFMQSFCGVDGSKLVVPMDILDRWFKKFQEKAKRDPEYLKSFVCPELVTKLDCRNFRFNKVSSASIRRSVVKEVVNMSTEPVNPLMSWNISLWRKLYLPQECLFPEHLLVKLKPTQPSSVLLPTTSSNILPLICSRAETLKYVPNLPTVSHLFPTTPRAMSPHTERRLPYTNSKVNS
ncbi:unnamed protein product [Rhodiola kirilowii]